MILTNKKITIKDWVIYAMFAALIVVFSQISVPLPFTPIPISLGNLAILLTGVLCSIRFKFGGALSILVYILLGAVGLPVFAGFKGGIGVLFGPTGGYIIGYLLMGLVCGFFYCDSNNRIKKLRNMLVLLCSLVVCLVCGTIWFMVSTETNLWQSLTLCVIPYIPGDLIKMGIAYVLIERLRPLIQKLK